MPKVLKRILIALAIIVFAGLVAFFTYICLPTQAQNAAEQALNSEGQWANNGVQVVNQDDKVAFIPQNPKAGLIFYPGIKIESKAYSPLMQELAERGILCVAPTIPFNISYFNEEAANGVRADYPQVSTWYIGGHSLGGISASHYIASHFNEFNGLILIGAPLNADLKDTNLRLLEITATYDQIKPQNDYLDMPDKAPADTTIVNVDGGNHSQFGDFGKLGADGDATISPEQQWNVTADIIANWINKA